jgi:RHS repeat-associated protein
VGAAGNLTVGLALTPSLANPGQTVTLSVTVASSQSGAITRTATLNGAPLALNAQGTAVFAAPAAGAHPIVVTASDGRTSVTREAVLLVRNASDNTAPTAAIASPEADAGLRGVVTVTGTASDAHLGYWQLLLRPAGGSDASWQEVARGLSAVTNGPLAQIDTSRHANGVYQLLLRVVDVNGAETAANVTAEFLGNLKLGQFRLSFADVRAEAPGLPLMLTRTYDSTKKDVMGDFGWGWSASGQDITVRKNMTFGAGWQVTQQQFQLCLKPVGRRRISITLPDGGLYRFDAANSPECQFGAVPEANPVFTAVPGPTGGPAGRLSATGQLRVINNTLVMAQGGMLVDADTGAPWNPTDFELTTEDGAKYLLREGVGVLSVTDAYGNKVTYGAGGYSHSANLSVTLTRDAQGRITKATDQNGKSLTYTYNGQGELASVTDRDGKSTQFGYATVPGANGAASSGNQDHRHLLASITDPRGQVVMSNQFDAYGRLTAAADGLGQAARQEFDLANFKQTVTDRRGNKTVYTFDAEGNITEVLNALGQKTSFTFDANGNETSVTNALGHKTERTFDAATGKQLSEKNALGHVTRTVYPGVGQAWQRTNPTASVDARGNTTTIGYLDEKQPGAIPLGIQEPLGRNTAIAQGAGGIIRSLNIAGEFTGYDYDSQGRRTRETNGLGHSTTYTYDALGNELSRTVAKSVNGTTVTHTVTRTYDAENRQTSETDALGGRRTTTYNAAGKVATQTDALGRVTSYSYDANARLTKTSYPDGTSETTDYDAEGNEVARTDRGGRTTRMEYDALGRLVKTTYPDGTSETSEYDAAGRIVATVDRRGKRATMDYDAAGRQTASVDASGRRTTQTYDENGNRTSVTADGSTTSYEYDALNRLTRTTWPDGSTHTVTYRPDNRKQSETDARGVTTTYGYDAAGRLTSVTQTGVSGSTSYGYDETGGKVRQVDALGRTTTWAIDANGRVTSRTIQDGSKEASQYDAEGNRLGKTTFAGERLSFQYDADNRLTGQAVPAGTGSNAAVPQALISYGYTASGQLQQQSEQGATTLAGTQTYKYDANDRLIEVKNPIGQIGYTLDANGNVTERSVAGVGTQRNEYDEAGRLAKVTAPDGKQARYTYDQAGRLTTTERDLNPVSGQAQVLVTYHRYDSADRTVAIAHVTKVGATQALVAGQALTRGAGGAITKIDTYRTGAAYDSATGQFSGTPNVTQDFEYDGNARLTREQRTSQGNTTDTRYEYDAAGNRSKKTVTTAAGAEITTYGYDNADRLTSESTTLPAGGSRTVSYTWDGNGNLASKTEAGKVTLYRFDPQNRLIDIRTGATQAEASAAQPSVSYAYDAAGNRIRKTTAQGTTGYLIDGSHAYPQVAQETKGEEATSYLHGVQTVRQTKGAEDIFPLPGHLNTSLGAVDASGVGAEQTNADAFGNLEQVTGLKQAHLYTGEYWDQDSQLVYLRARWYEPRLGAFVAADPLEGRVRDPRTLNRYGYVHGDPLHYTDPSGLFESVASLSIGQSASLGVSAGATTAAGMFLRNLAIACASTVAASTAFPGTPLPGPAALCTSNTMRVHLQVSRSPFPGKGTIHTTAPGEGVIQGIPVWGVTVDMVNRKMLELNDDLPTWWHAEQPLLKSLIIDVSKQIQRIKLSGGVREYRISAATAQLPYQRLYYRLDVDNLRG